jgi:hypothetical protein
MARWRWVSAKAADASGGDGVVGKAWLVEPAAGAEFGGALGGAA